MEGKAPNHHESIQPSEDPAWHYLTPKECEEIDRACERFWARHGRHKPSTDFRDTCFAKPRSKKKLQKKSD